MEIVELPNHERLSDVDSVLIGQATEENLLNTSIELIAVLDLYIDLFDIQVFFLPIGLHHGQILEIVDGGGVVVDEVLDLVSLV